MRCVNCGLLAMRKKSDASLAEVPGYIREKDPTTRTAVVNKFEDEHEITPVCLARQATFSPKKEEYSEQFKEERDCPGFTEWRQGFTPKEHSEMAMHDLAESNRRIWEEKQALLTEKRHRQTMRMAIKGIRRASRDSRWNTIMAVICGVLGAAATLGVVFLERCVSGGR